jgi:hypothetical protein
MPTVGPMSDAAIVGTLRVSPPDATSLGAGAGLVFAGAWELARRLAPQRPSRDTDLRAVYRTDPY